MMDIFYINILEKDFDNADSFISKRHSCEKMNLLFFSRQNITNKLYYIRVYENSFGPTLHLSYGRMNLSYGLTKKYKRIDYNLFIRELKLKKILDGI